MKLPTIFSVLLVLVVASVVQAGDCGCGTPSCASGCNTCGQRSHGKCCNPCCGRLFPTFTEVCRGFGALLPCGSCCGGCGPTCGPVCCPPKVKTCPCCKPTCRPACTSCCKAPKACSCPKCLWPALKCCPDRPRIGCTSGCSSGCCGGGSGGVTVDDGHAYDSGLTLPPAPARVPTPAPKRMHAAPEPMAPEMMKVDPFKEDSTSIQRAPTTRPVRTSKATPTSGKTAAVEMPAEEVSRVAHIATAKSRNDLRPEVDQFAEEEGRPASFVHVPSRPVRSSTTTLPVNPLRR